MRAARRARDDRDGRAARLPADRRPRRLRQGGAGAAVRRRQRSRRSPGAPSPCRRSAAPARSRSAPTSCAALRPKPQVWISDPSWENHRALFEGAGFTRQPPTPTTTPRRAVVDFDGDAGGRSTRTARPARSSCCTPAATTRPASIPAESQWTTSSTSSARADWCRSSTSPTRASATASTPTAPSCAASPRRRDRCSSRARSPSRSRSMASASAR